jgi:hypothetical protein
LLLAQKDNIIKQMMDKNRFYKVYGNLPLNVRDEIVVVINGEPMSWKVAKVEVDNDTRISKLILSRLIALEII